LLLTRITEGHILCVSPDYKRLLKESKNLRRPANGSTVLPEGRFSRILKGMEVHFTPETEKKLKDLAAQSGRGTADELVRDVVEGDFDELAQARDMLNSRYDDLKSGKVKPISGGEVKAYFREKSAAARRPRPGS